MYSSALRAFVLYAPRSHDGVRAADPLELAASCVAAVFVGRHATPHLFPTPHPPFPPCPHTTCVPRLPLLYSRGHSSKPKIVTIFSLESAASSCTMVASDYSSPTTCVCRVPLSLWAAPARCGPSPVSLAYCVLPSGGFRGDGPVVVEVWVCCWPCLLCGGGFLVFPCL
jgi:hypothetical protein